MITLVAAALRLHQIGASAPHYDELWHLECSTARGSPHEQLAEDRLTVAPAVTSLRGAGPWWSIWNRMDDYVHPPLYEMLLRGWREAFGESVAAGRALSATLSVLCVAAMWWAVRQLHGSNAAALLAALLMAVAPAQVGEAQEVRNYAMATLAVLCAAGAFGRIARGGATWTWSLLLFVAATVALFTHYFTAPALAAVGAYAALWLRGPARRNATGALVAAALAFVVLWGPHVLQQRGAMRIASAPTSGFAESESDHAAATARRVAMLPARVLFEPPARGGWLAAGGAALYMLPWLLVRREPRLALWTLWLTLVAVCAAALDLINHTMHLEITRHVIMASPAVCALAAAVFAALWPARPGLAYGASGVVALACAAALPGSYRREQIAYDELAGALDASNPDEPVLFSAASPEQRPWAGVLYLACSHYSPTFPRPAALLLHPASPEFLAELNRHPQCWLVAANGSPPAETLLPGVDATPVGGEPYLGMVYRLRWSTQNCTATTPRRHE